MFNLRLCKTLLDASDGHIRLTELFETLLTGKMVNALIGSFSTTVMIPHSTLNEAIYTHFNAESHAKCFNEQCLCV